VEDATQRALEDLRRLRDCLQGTFFLERLKVTELDKLMSVMKKLKVPAGYTVFKQGDKGDTFFLVSKGQLSFLVRKGKEEKKVAELRPLDYFGETALISDAPRSATVKAETDCELFILHKADFHEILMANSWIAEEIRAQMERKSQIRKRS
jgi:CRP-like cAMP-binding protein